jgi:hypothetical protein
VHIGSIGIEGNRDKTQDTPTYLLLGIPVLPSPLYPTSNPSMQEYPIPSIYCILESDSGIFPRVHWYLGTPGV